MNDNLTDIYNIELPKWVSFKIQSKPYNHELIDQIRKFTNDEVDRDFKLEYLATTNINDNCLNDDYFQWCTPDGVRERGAFGSRYPTIKEVLKEWQYIAQEFPMLDLICTLGEYNDLKSWIEYVTYYVKNGEVTINKIKENEVVST